MRIFSYIFFILVAFIGLTFACLNADPVAINYYVGTTQLPLSLLLALTLVVGCALGLLISLVMFLRLKSENMRLRHRAKLAEKEVSNLRALPLTDAHD